MKKYEYKVAVLKGTIISANHKLEEKMNAQLNELCTDGWELVNCVPVSMGELFMAVVKREIQE
jgi:hypothetical protein